MITQPEEGSLFLEDLTGIYPTTAVPDLTVPNSPPTLTLFM